MLMIGPKVQLDIDLQN